MIEAKKYFKAAFFYLIAAMIAGVFYREFTKIMKVSGETVLAVSHVHLFVLGVCMFLITGILVILSDIEKQKYFRYFYITYNIGLPLMLVSFLAKGIMEIIDITLYRNNSILISVLAGISHIIIAAALVMFFMSLMKAEIRSKA